MLKFNHLTNKHFGLYNNNNNNQQQHDYCSSMLVRIRLSSLISEQLKLRQTSSHLDLYWNEMRTKNCLTLDFKS